MAELNALSRNASAVAPMSVGQNRGKLSGAQAEELAEHWEHSLSSFRRQRTAEDQVAYRFFSVLTPFEVPGPLATGSM